MSKPDEITLWAAVDKSWGEDKWVYGLEPTWNELSGGYESDDHDDICKEVDDNDSYIFLFDDLAPGYKRPVTLKVKLGKAVKG